MVFIYDKTTGQIKFFYSGNVSQIANFKEAENLAEAIFEDDPEVLERPQDYRIVVVCGRAITYAKKPSMKLAFKNENGEDVSQSYVFGDGTDEAVLHVKVSDLHPLDEFSSIYSPDNVKNLQLYFNEELITVEAETSGDTNVFVVPITSNQPGLVLNIRGNDNLYLTNSVILEVV